MKDYIQSFAISSVGLRALPAEVIEHKIESLERDVILAAVKQAKGRWIRVRVTHEKKYNQDLAAWEFTVRAECKEG